MMSALKEKILICDKSREDTQNILKALIEENYSVYSISDEQKAIKHIQKSSYSLILLGSEFSKQGEIYFIELIKKFHPQTLVMLLLSQQYPFKKTIEASRKGAYDFLYRNLPILDILNVVKKSLDRRKLGLKNTQLFAEIQVKNRQLEWRVKELSALYKIAQAIVSQSSVDDALNSLFQAIKEVIDIDYFLCLTCTDSKNLNIYFARGVTDEVLDRLSKSLKKKNYQKITLQKEKIDSIASCTKIFVSSFRTDGLNSLVEGSFVAIPIFNEKEIYGIFGVGSHKEDIFSEEETQLLSIISSQALSLYEKISRLAKSTQLITMGEMISEIAHDLKNPITSIKGTLQNLEHRWYDEDFRIKSMDIVSKGLYRLNELVAELLDFSNPEKFPLKTLAINDLITKILKLIKSDLANKNIKLILNLTPESLVNRVNEKRLKEAFLNIIVNALEAMPNGGDLEIATNNISKKEHEEYLRIKFADTGIGMSEEIKLKIFNHFFSTKPTGTGLGLSVVNRVIKAHNGFIEVESQIGKGTTFLLNLPLKKEK